MLRCRFLIFSFRRKRRAFIIAWRCIPKHNGYSVQSALRKLLAIPRVSCKQCRLSPINVVQLFYHEQPLGVLHILWCRGYILWRWNLRAWNLYHQTMVRIPFRTPVWSKRGCISPPTLQIVDLCSSEDLPRRAGMKRGGICEYFDRYQAIFLVWSFPAPSSFAGVYARGRWELQFVCSEGYSLQEYWSTQLWCAQFVQCFIIVS